MQAAGKWLRARELKPCNGQIGITYEVGTLRHQCLTPRMHSDALDVALRRPNWVSKVKDQRGFEKVVGERAEPLPGRPALIQSGQKRVPPIKMLLLSEQGEHGVEMRKILTR